MDGNLTALQRLWLAFVAFFAVLFDRRFAEEVHLVRGRLKALPAGGEASKAPSPAPSPEPRRSAGAQPSPPAPAPSASPAAPSPESSALHVLHLLQRDGRLVDFLSEDLNGFSDAEIGAAARTVNEGCRK
ncbi:MAG TPA: DUF2760 domain-containing protein, partial [Anaeromyxobacteraceae bacterium]|nr:DUF2760 domain-containing protein [Anaeromyxobacteraceae bacterium]